jgi:hypothetical protein
VYRYRSSRNKCISIHGNARHIDPTTNQTGSDEICLIAGYRTESGSIARDYANHSNTTSPASNKGGSIVATPKATYRDTTPYYPANDVKSPPQTPYFLPSTTYQPPSHPSAEPIAMLDSTPVLRNKPRSPRFHEHISELADTSSPAPIPTPNAGTTQWSGGTYLNGDAASSNVPRTEVILSGYNVRLDEARRRQEQLHLMSWNNYDNNRATELQDGGFGATVGQGETQRGGDGMHGKEGEVSPDHSESPLDREFIVSPMGILDKGRR